MMLNKYRYKNKMRYNIRQKKNEILSWEKGDTKPLVVKTQYKKQNKWRGNMFWKFQNINNIMYKAASKTYKELTNNFWKEKRSYNDWAYHPGYVYRKRPFFTKVTNRKNFIDNILLCIKKKDSLYYLRNSLYYLLENKIGFNKIFDVLNFSWLYISKDEKKNYEVIESLNSLALKFFYKGFIKNSKKRKCETKFIELLSLLKLKLKKASLHIMYYFITYLKPVVGFRRQRLGRLNQKKKDIRYFFQLYGHNKRWQSLLFKRMCFNSPYYVKRTQYVSVMDIYKGLIASIVNRGPISKCLGMYYSLIGRRTPYAKRQKKKKKRKSKLARF